MLKPSKPEQPESFLDDVVCLYLEERHHVKTTPVSSCTGPSRGTNALMGAVGGPLAMGMNAALTNQQKSTQLQEWLTWKTFALQQPDFPAYKQTFMDEHQQALERYETACFEYEIYSRSPEGKAEALKIQKEEAFAKTISITTLFAFLFAGVFGMVLGNTQSTPPPASSTSSLNY